MIRVSVVSESEFMTKGHGVHTAYIELTNALRKLPDVDIAVNRKAPADITHIHTVGAYALYRLLFDHTKKVVSAHVVPASFVGSLAGANLWLPLAKVYLRWFYNRADIVFAVSDETKRELQDLGVKKPIEIVYNLIDTLHYKTTPQDKAVARQKLKIAKDAWVIIGAGQVQPRKRVDDFVRIANELPDMQFIWVGGMPFARLAADNRAMQHMMDTAPTNMLFTGIIDHSEIKAYYQSADVFWLPSEQETFGLVVVEAAAVGLPVVLRDIPDYKETFAGHAILCSPEKIVEMLQRLATDADFYELSRRGAEKIAIRYDSSKGAMKVAEIYHTLLK